MSWIDNLTIENIGISFDLQTILTDSVFYPNAALDATDIEQYYKQSMSFIHTDECTSEAQIRAAMFNDFHMVGYDTLPIQNINLEGFKFALWTVLVVRPNANHYSDGSKKARRLSLLHVCSNIEFALKQLYEKNGLKPLTIYTK